VKTDNDAVPSIAMRDAVSKTCLRCGMNDTVVVSVCGPEAETGNGVEQDVAGCVRLHRLKHDRLAGRGVGGGHCKSVIVAVVRASGRLGC
jgi:hypothetical protein